MAKHIIQLICLLVSTSFVFPQTNPDDKYWSSEFAIPTTDEVRTMLVDGDYVYYNEFGRLVRWNLLAKEYDVLGISGAGSIYCIAKFNEEIYIGGNFEKIGGLSTSFIAKWRNGVWDTVVTGINGKVSAICFDDNGDLWLGGQFTSVNGFESNYLARRKSGIWEPVVGFNGQVRTIVNNNGQIYAGGDFNFYDSTLSEYSLVAKFDGNKWSNAGYLGSNAGGKVMSLSVSPEGFILAGGIFENDGADSISPNIAYYDGEKWNSIGDGFDGMVLSVEATGNKFYAGGYFKTSGGMECKSIAEFEGTGWTEVNGGITGTDYPSILCLSNSPRGLFAGGNFSKAGNLVCWNTAYLNNGVWNNFLPDKRNGTISSIGCFAVDKMNDILYAGGGFVRTGNVVSYGISQFNGKDWIGCNSGLTPTSNVVYSLQAVTDTVFFTGWFNYADGIRLRNVAKWIESRKTWEPVGNGIEGGDGDMGPILVTRDKIYVAGNFGYVMNGTDTVFANHITFWDGCKWNRMGDGIARKDSRMAVVEKIIEAPDGRIFVCGFFDLAGGTEVSNFAVWDPKSGEWSGNNSKFNGSVYTMLIYGNYVYFGGAFKYIDSSIAVNGFARWNIKTDSWAVCDSGVDATGGIAGTVNAMIKWGDDIYIAGRFRTASGNTCNSVARYNPQDNKIYPLGSGLVYGIYSTANPNLASVSDLIVYKNELYFGGMFTTAGNKKSSSNIAKWTKVPVSVETRTVNAELNIYPNPATEYIEIILGAQRAVSDGVAIFDLLGMEVTSLSTSPLPLSMLGEGRIRIDVSHLSPGVYFIRVADVLKKFVKM